MICQSQHHNKRFRTLNHQRVQYLFVIILTTCLLWHPALCSLNLNLLYEQQQNLTSIFPVITEGQVERNFNSSTFNNVMSCANGMLKLVEFNDTQYPKIIQFSYAGQEIAEKDIEISYSPNPSPSPTIYDYSEDSFSLKTNCNQNPTKNDYYNLISISIKNKQYQFSFLLNCDKTNRYKKFELGYLIIGVINAFITIGVALHSRIWSIKFNGDPLKIELTWKKFLAISLVIVIMGVTVYLVASSEFQRANEMLKYVGMVVSFFFTFICLNETFYLVSKLRYSLCKTTLYDFRRCQLISLIGAIALFIISFYMENWLYFTFLAGCICVGSIKMFHFTSMKQAVYSFIISVTTVTITSIVLHFILTRSYNDYASELMSPLFIEVPDLVDNLFKKCSWLPVIDIIIPGVFLSYLRTYDQNYSSRYGGVYTVTGNLSFLLGTVAWVSVQVIYPYSVPFSLVTYSILLICISAMAIKRNQLKTLWNGSFLQNLHINPQQISQQFQRSTGQLLGQGLMDNMKYGKGSMHSQSQVEDEENERNYDQEFSGPNNNNLSQPLKKPKTHQSGLRPRTGQGATQHQRSPEGRKANSKEGSRSSYSPHKSNLR